ncbi:unnamed protein product [Toxocara canis]|uniref:Sushi domain-containing protein n=1 Tax=Toxocara canis TaxID=6265 RepID=A0A183UB38_TOXCA|nr:unnamed protein product [Toxocara canis]
MRCRRTVRNIQQLFLPKQWAGIECPFRYLPIIHESAKQAEIGRARRNCLATGRWSNAIPQCQPVDCGPLEEWSEGSVTLLNGSTTFQSIAEYRCSRVTYLSSLSPTHRICGQDSVWSTRLPFCSPFDGPIGFTLNASIADKWKAYLRVKRYSVNRKSKSMHVAFTDEEAICALDVLSSEALQERKYISTRPIVYAAASQITDSNIYYASTGMHTTEIELPPHLVGVQHLPHENIHVTLPHLRPVSRSSLAVAMRASNRC